MGSTKTSRSRRTVSIGDTLGRDLLALVEGRGPDELLFVNARGGQMRHNTFWETNWTTAVQAAQNPPGPGLVRDWGKMRLARERQQEQQEGRQ